MIAIQFSQPAHAVASRGDTYGSVAKEVKKRLAGDKEKITKFETLYKEGHESLKAHSDARTLQKQVSKLVDITPGIGHIVSDDDQVYWLLQSLHQKSQITARHRQVGAWFERRGKRWHVGEVFQGTPAFRAGLQRGDEILAVNNYKFEPVYSVKNLKTAEAAFFKIKRTPWGEPTTIKVDTVVESLEESMLRATKLSVQIKRLGDKDIGYIRLWDGSSEEIRGILKHVTRKFSGKTSGMILDLRGGIGVTIEGLESFFLTGKGQTYKAPLFILVNRFTADGKQRLAHILKLQAKAMIIGERPMGAKLAGKIITLEPRSSLAFFPDTTTITALTLDKRVKDTLVYTGGHDTMLWEALKLAANK